MILYRHETSQIAAGIDNINKLFLNPDSEFYISKQNSNKQKDIYNDIERFILLLSSMSQRIKIIQGRHKLNKREFEEIWVIKEVFMNWVSAFSTIKDARYLEFIIPETNQYDKLRPRIISDQVLLNQIVFNLFGNAIKYAYKGTIIHLDYKLPFKLSQQKTIKITNYGIGITNDHNLPYELYYTEDKGKKYSADSNGIGLYVVKKAVEMLDGDRNHHSEEIAPFVIPYMEPFLNYIKMGEISRDELSFFDNKPVSEYEKEVKQQLEII